MTARPSHPAAHRAHSWLLAFACLLTAASGVALAWPVVAGVDGWGWLGWPLGGFGVCAGLWLAQCVRTGRVS